MARSNDLARQEIARLTALVSSLAVRQLPVVASPAPPAPVPSAPPAPPTSYAHSASTTFMSPPPPKPFSGSDRADAESIVHSAEIVFDLNAAHFPDPLGVRKVLYFASFLSGDAHKWYENLRAAASPAMASWLTFRAAFLRDWGTQTSSADAYMALLNLRQTSTVIAHTASFNSLRNRISTATPLDPALLVALYVNSLYLRHRQALDHVRVNRYGGDGVWPSVYEAQSSARDLDTHIAQPGYANPAAAAPSPRPRPLPVNRLSTLEYPALPPPFVPSYPVSTYAPSQAPLSVAPSSPPRLDVLLAQTRRPADQDRADRKARADEREARGLCRYCGEPGHKVDSCAALARKEASKIPPGSFHPKG